MTLSRAFFAGAGRNAHFQGEGMTNLKDQIQSYFFGLLSATTGVKVSDYTLTDWLTLEPLQFMSEWDFTGWGAALGVVLGIAGVCFRLVADISTEVRNRRKHRLEIEILRLQLNEQRGSSDGGSFDNSNSGGPG